MKISGSHIILTGAASGIGLALLRELAGYPAHIIAVDLNAERLARAIDGIPDPQAAITAFVCDVSSAENIDRLFEHALNTLGGVDLFIANAGFAYYEKIARADWTHIEQVYRANVFAPIYSALKMKDLSGARPYTVVITASAMGLLALPGYALYSSTKAALDRFAEGYRFELDDPRHLMLVYPIGTRTRFFETAAKNAPLTWPIQTPEHVARAIVKGIERDRQAVYPSQLFRLFLWLDRLLPFMRRIEQRIERRRFEKWQAASQQDERGVIRKT